MPMEQLEARAAASSSSLPARVVPIEHKQSLQVVFAAVWFKLLRLREQNAVNTKLCNDAYLQYLAARKTFHKCCEDVDHLGAEWRGVTEGCKPFKLVEFQGEHFLQCCCCQHYIGGGDPVELLELLVDRLNWSAAILATESFREGFFSELEEKDPGLLEIAYLDAAYDRDSHNEQYKKVVDQFERLTGRQHSKFKLHQVIVPLVQHWQSQRQSGGVKQHKLTPSPALGSIFPVRPADKWGKSD
jgi:hypothetical protein